MIADLQKLLDKMIEDRFDANAIEKMKELIKKEKERQKTSSKALDNELEAARAASLGGLQAHLAKLNAAQAGFNQKRQKLLEERNALEAGAARDAKNQELLELEEREKINERRVQTAKDINAKFENFGFVTDFTKSKTGRFLSDMGGAFDALGATMSSALKPANLFAAGVDQMVSATKDLFTNFDTAQAELSKVTATTGEYNDMLYDLQESNKTFGVDAETAGKAIGDLHNELSSFNQMSSATQGMLAETTARMEVLGVKTGSGAKQFDNMIQGMGMTATMANDASMELVALGGAIGMAADTISEGFNAAASELAKYGSDAIDVFKGLASAAKATGIEMGSLMSITKQFDTFEGAAAGAGKLNAILGGGVINSMDLLNGTEEERIRLLIQSIAASGKNFESLNKFEKQAIASAAGISDMAEANKLFSMSLSAYDEMQAKGSEANAEAAMMEERAQAVQTLSKKLEMIGQSFAIAFMPLLEFMHGFANMILMINDMTGGMFVPAMVGLIGVIALLSKATAINNAVMQIGMGIRAASALVSGGFAAAQGVLAGATATESLTATSAIAPNAMLGATFMSMLVPVLLLTPAIVGLGMGLLGLGLAIAAPFLALAAIVTAFKDLFIAMLEAPKAIGAAITGLLAFAVAGSAAMVIMATGMVAATMILSGFAPTMLTVAPALMSFALSMAVAGAAMYLAGAGLKSMGEGLAAFNDVTPEALITAIVGLAAFGVGLVAFMTVASLPMLVVGIGLMLFGAGLKSFAKGLKEFNKVGLEEMAMAGLALVGFGLLLIKASFPMGIAALALGIPLMMIGAGLKSFAKGIKEFSKVGVDDMMTAAIALVGFGLLLIKASFPMGIAALLLAIPLMMISAALGMFAENLIKFNKVGLQEILTAGAALLMFGILMIGVTSPIAFAAAIIAVPLTLLGLALVSFASGLQEFNDVGAGGILLAVSSLMLFAIAMAVLEPLLPIMIAGFLLLSVPMIMFGAGLSAIGIGLLLIGAGMSTFTGLTEVLSVISAIGLSGAAAMGVLAVSIMGIAMALAFIPESKSIAFGFAMEGYGAAIAAVAALSPDTVELSERVVAAAGEYAEIQAEMKMPDEDSFVQAMKNVFGMGDKKGDSGKNIILQLNGRELGRAVDVQLNKMHNLSID